MSQAPRLRLFWRAFLRGVIVFLGVVLFLVLFLGLNPTLLRALILSLHPAGVVEIPNPAPAPLPPQIDVPRGKIPSGYLAYSGATSSGSFGCSFLLELEDGQRVGVGAAHATPLLAPGAAAEFRAPGDLLAARLQGQVARGSAFAGSEFRTDYVLWLVVDVTGVGQLLHPDPRGQAQPGEAIVVFALAGDGAGASVRHTGVVMRTAAQATWIQLDESFNPRGYSGCPVVSAYTGRLVGMAVAGEDKPPVVMGLHPVGSLVEKVNAVLSAH
jgi:hypothetical protein